MDYYWIQDLLIQQILFLSKFRKKRPTTRGWPTTGATTLYYREKGIIFSLKNSWLLSTIKHKMYFFGSAVINNTSFPSLKQFLSPTIQEDTYQNSHELPGDTKYSYLYVHPDRSTFDDTNTHTHTHTHTHSLSLSLSLFLYIQLHERHIFSPLKVPYHYAT